MEKPKSILQTLREKQAANPPAVVQTEDGTSLLSARTPERRVDIRTSPSGGYVRIFPSTFENPREIPADWKAANWEAPSPWCRIEGQPDHPEFSANLTSIFK